MKRNRLSIVALSCLVLWPLLGHAQQSFEREKEAFAKSYLHESRGEYAQAIQALAQTYRADAYPWNLRLGWLHYLQGDYERARSYYQRAIDLKPMSIEARLGLVLPLSAMGNWDAVVQTYRDILDIDPNHATVRYRLGTLYYNREQFRLAEQQLEKVVNHYPFDGDSLLMLAWTKYSLGKRDDARLLFQQVLLYNPQNTSAQQGLELCNN